MSLFQALKRWAWFGRPSGLHRGCANLAAGFANDIVRGVVTNVCCLIRLFSLKTRSSPRARPVRGERLPSLVAAEIGGLAGKIVVQSGQHVAGVDGAGARLPRQQQWCDATGWRHELAGRR